MPFHIQVKCENNLCQSVREMSTSGCHQLYRSTCSNYIQKHTISDHCIKHIIVFFSRPFCSAIIRVSKQCLNVSRHVSICLENVQSCLDIVQMCQHNEQTHEQTMSRHIFGMPMLLPMAPLHLLSHNDQNEVKPDFLIHGMSLVLALLSYK